MAMVLGWLYQDLSVIVLKYVHKKSIFIKECSMNTHALCCRFYSKVWEQEMHDYQTVANFSVYLFAKHR